MPPLIFVPMPSEPFSTLLVGVALESPGPKTTFLFLMIMFASTIIVPTGESNGSAVTFASVCTVNEVALAVAPVTGQRPSKFVTVLLPIVI